MEVTESGITKVSRFLQPSKRYEEIVLIDVDNLMVWREVLSLKASDPMADTLLPIETSVKNEHPLKA